MSQAGRYVPITWLALAAFGIGCSSPVKGTGGSGGIASASSNTGASTSGTCAPFVCDNPSATTGGGPPGHDIQSAVSLQVNTPLSASFVDVFKTHDFYSFTGTAGERIVIGAEASGANGPSATVPDPMLSLIGNNKDPANPLVFQPGRWPAEGKSWQAPPLRQGSLLYVQLPVDGTYYLDVADCNTIFGAGCPDDQSTVTNLGYSVFVIDTSKLMFPEARATGANKDQGSALALTYHPSSMAAAYDDNVMGGAFTGASQTEVFAFTPPAGAAAPAGAKSRAEFYLQPIKTDEGSDLSLTNVKLWITDATGNELASADQASFHATSTTYSPLDLSTPFTPGATYYLFVQNDAFASPLTSFYFIDHYLNPVIDVAEKNVGLNAHATYQTAEALTPEGAAKDYFTVDGSIAAVSPSPDVDFYSMTIPAGYTKLAMFCNGARSGQGLGGLSATLYQANGTSPIESLSETATAELADTMWNPFPMGVSAGDTIYLKVTATSQDATNTGNNYRCSVRFSP